MVKLGHKIVWNSAKCSGGEPSVSDQAGYQAADTARGHRVFSLKQQIWGASLTKGCVHFVSVLVSGTVLFHCAGHKHVKSGTDLIFSTEEISAKFTSMPLSFMGVDILRITSHATLLMVARFHPSFGN